MKPTTKPSKNEPKPNRPFLRKSEALEKRLESQKKNMKRLRIVQSVNLGHVRGGHSFH
ncbi:MAG: hypothetical protein WBW16_14950 [Bacteroidota bacterium]